jgi:aerobic carbon-monoxide dehydrogenase small subunit
MTHHSAPGPQTGSGEAAPDEVPVRITVNGREHDLSVEPRRDLADVLRRECGSAGTQVGCDLGVCGSCTVIADGDPVRACVMLAAEADGAAIETVESLAPDGKLSPLQQAFKEKFALQCGFCTPGFLMLATALLRREPEAGRERIREVLSANLCRCTGYAAIVEAVESAVSL